MASHEHDSSGPRRPPTPGLHLGRSTPPPYEAYTSTYTSESPTRLASLDLTSTRDAYGKYDTWTELHEFPSSVQKHTDTQKLLGAHVRRSSTASSVSSHSTVVRQDRLVGWLNSIDNSIEAFCRLPGIRHIIWPFQWLGLAMRNSRFCGWRMGIIIGSCMSFMVLGINITILIVGATRGKGFENGFAVPMSGAANDMSWWSSAMHIVINALSTILLAASNYTMQVLSSPTREDIDKAHAKHEHLDIGVLSVRNLTRIPRRRLVLFILMGMSTIPIHLFYNSTVFYIGSNNQYDVHTIQTGSKEYQDMLKDVSYDQIPGDKWLTAYDTDLVRYGTLFLVVDEYRSRIDTVTLNGRPTTWPSMVTWEANDWNAGKVNWTLQSSLKYELSTTGFLQTIMETNAESKQWIRMDLLYNMSSTDIPSGDPPKFAHVPQVFAQKLDTDSRIQLSLIFLIIVIVCNSIKLPTMLWVAFMERKDYLVTLGDGAASFLEHPDPTTQRMCILSKQDIVREVADAPSKAHHNDQLSRLVTQSGKRWTKQLSTYSNALNRDREVGSYFIFIVIGILFAGFLATVTTLGQTSTKWGSASDTTFRKADSSERQTLLNAWIANAGQLVLSFCYLAINSECTAMAGAAEWNNLATSRKGLRVTRPVGQQRDTYFLQLPYRWSLPLTIASGGLHWLLSQSIFLVRVDTYDRQGNLVMGDASKSACGFSGTSWIALTGSFFVLVGTVGVIGRRKFKVKIPFAASCSLVISAACHAPRGESEAYLRPLRWGVVEERMYDGEKHCSLSEGNVTKPKAGEQYL